jgi:glutathione synthase
MRIAFQMDPLESLNAERDTSLLLIKEALKRGWEVFSFQPKDILVSNHIKSLENVELIALCSELRLGDNGVVQRALCDIEINLNSLDFLWIRQDPPFNLSYITSTYFFEYLNNVTILNSPVALRNNPEKLSPLRFSRWMPPTMIAYNPEACFDFLQSFGSVIVKPLYEFSGRYIAKASNKNELLQAFKAETIRNPDLPLMVQKFLPEVKDGDKRIFIVHGEFAGCFIKKPGNHEYLSNLAHGGVAIESSLSHREAEISEEVGRFLKEQDILFAGLDVIADQLTEINITSPTGIPTLNRLYNRTVESDIWEKALQIRELQLERHLL